MNVAMLQAMQSPGLPSLLAAAISERMVAYGETTQEATQKILDRLIRASCS